ncbi:MAG: hypothetical protein ACRC4X_05310 [Cetobacterium sp.]
MLPEIQPAFEYLFVVTVRDRKNKIESSITVATMSEDKLALNAALRRLYGFDWHGQDIIKIVKLNYKPVCGQCASFFESRMGGYCTKHEQQVSVNTKMCRLGVMNAPF